MKSIFTVTEIIPEPKTIKGETFIISNGRIRAWFESLNDAKNLIQSKTFWKDTINPIRNGKNVYLVIESVPPGAYPDCKEFLWYESVLEGEEIVVKLIDRPKILDRTCCFGVS